MSAILYLSPRLHGAMTAEQADALDYIDRRIGHVLNQPTLRAPSWGGPDGMPPPAAPAAPPVHGWL